MKKLICLIAVLSSMNCQAQAPPSKPVKWLTAELPPFIWLQHNKPQGYAYELIVAMSAQIGRPPDVTFYPWARAVKMTAEGNSYGVFPLARTPDRENSYKWLIPMIKVNYTFFGNRSALAKGVDIEHANLEQLSHLRVGILRGSPIEMNLKAKNFRHIIYEKSYQDLIRMLSLGGIDAIYAGYPMLTSAIEEYGFRFEDFATGPSLGSAQLYLATSLDLRENEERAWRIAYESLQKDGTVAKLQKKYFHGQ
ncbi:substrate-binding periplasmic protein [Undibacterium sp. TJN19]|uniref:substrate-binding periplasmic protein n=1 Tax=Undibacterium sp. TJN19 TaxID=3413055 RepID=UPI003BF4118A